MIDTATNTVKARVPIPSAGYGTASTRDGRYLLVCMRALKQVAVIDLQTMKVVHTLDVPGAPQEVLVRPDGKFAYASCQKKFAVIDIAHWAVRPALRRVKARMVWPGAK